MDTDRINSLQENYDKLNYSAYSITDKNVSHKLILNVLEQHFRLSQSMDFLSFLFLLEEDCPFDIEINHIIQMLVGLGFDKLEEAQFIKTIEKYLYITNGSQIKDYYVEYLEKFVFSFNHHPWPDYDISTFTAYSEIPHLALINLFSSNVETQERILKQLEVVEERFQPWPLWEPTYGLSRDHDNVLLFEFPMYLTLLSVSFIGTNHSPIFSRKLRNILEKSIYPEKFNLFGLVWLLIAAQISKDKSSYDYALSRNNSENRIYS